jgi:hypothetical protein
MKYTIQSKQEIKKSAVAMILTMAQTSKPLYDHDSIITTQILYYDEKTPRDYNPEFFKELTKNGKNS